MMLKVSVVAHEHHSWKNSEAESNYQTTLVICVNLAE